jgi:hypothetical protein
MILDTSPEITDLQRRLLREAGPEKRLMLASSLSSSVVSLSKSGIRNRHPEMSDFEVDLRFVALCYGQDLSDRVRARWRSRHEPA